MATPCGLEPVLMLAINRPFSGSITETPSPPKFVAKARTTKEGGCWPLTFRTKPDVRFHISTKTKKATTVAMRKIPTLFMSDLLLTFKGRVFPILFHPVQLEGPRPARRRSGQPPPSAKRSRRKPEGNSWRQSGNRPELVLRLRPYPRWCRKPPSPIP